MARLGPAALLLLVLVSLPALYPGASTVYGRDGMVLAYTVSFDRDVWILRGMGGDGVASILSFSRAEVVVSIEGGVVGFNFTLADARLLNYNMSSREIINETEWDRSSFSAAYEYVETPYGIVLLRDGLFAAMPIYYVGGPLPLDEPSTRIVVPPRPVILGACIVPGDLAGDVGAEALLESMGAYEVLPPGSEGTLELPGGLLLTLSNPSNSTPVTVVAPCMDSSVLTITVDPLERPSLGGELPLAADPAVAGGAIGARVEQLVAGETSVYEALPGSLWIVEVAGGSVLVFLDPGSAVRHYWETPIGAGEPPESLIALHGAPLIVGSPRIVYHRLGFLVEAELSVPSVQLALPLVFLDEAYRSVGASVFQAPGSQGPLKVYIALSRVEGLALETPIVSVRGEDTATTVEGATPAESTEGLEGQDDTLLPVVALAVAAAIAVVALLVARGVRNA
ncbi:MAG: hypothetical protein LRS43_04650 [Desulfurococcales archaeon]|nr:hypothetical protein [Desulfurococcales archaeon]